MKKFRVSIFKFRIREFNIQHSTFKTQLGFTLLEVVVAMAIVGLGIVALLEIFSLGLRLETASSARTDAVAYSRQAVDAFLIRKSFDGRGDSGSIGRSHRWEIDVQPVRDDTRLESVGWDISEITLRMRYPEAERDKLLEMKTLRVVKRKRE
jgi:prepilin-type N-terminal cleavage/methylation domain-containing protein